MGSSGMKCRTFKSDTKAMPYTFFFSMSTGLSKPITVPAGTLEWIMRKVRDTEKKLGLKRRLVNEEHHPGLWSWERTERAMLRKLGRRPGRERCRTDYTPMREWDARKERMATAVRSHNSFVEGFYEQLGKWSEEPPAVGSHRGLYGAKVEAVEELRPEDSAQYWGGLAKLEWPREHWTKDHFTEHMEHLYEVLAGRESRGVTIDCKPLEADQISALIVLFEAELDQWNYDRRFAVPLDEELESYDRIACSDEGGYDWCSHCGPINSDDFRKRCEICPRRGTGECELRNDHPGEFDEEEEGGGDD